MDYSAASSESPCGSCGEDGRVDDGEGTTGTVERLRRERDDALRREEDVEDTLRAFSEATRLLTRFVTSPTETASCERCNSATEDVNAECRTCSAGRSLEEERLLERLFVAAGDRRLERTGFPALLNGCDMLRESLRLTAVEADDAVAEARAANEAAASAKSKLRVACKALGKLKKENAKLDMERRLERRTLAREVAKFVDVVNDRKDRQLHEAAEAYALLAHERALSPMSGSTRTTEASSLGDDDLGALSFPTPSSPGTSLVTEGAAATVCLSPSGTRIDHDDDNSPASTSSEDANKGEEFAISRFGRGDSFQGDGTDVSVGNVIGALMNRDGIERGVYHIDFSNKKIGIKLRAIPARPRLSDKGRDNSIVKPPPPGAPSERAFIVCGFTDPSIEKRPKLGARLVAVDGASLEYGEWTLKAVCDRIRTSEGGALRLSFRNDVLSQDDMAYLNRILSTPKCDDKEGDESKQARIGREGQQHSSAATAAAQMTNPPEQTKTNSTAPKTPQRATENRATRKPATDSQAQSIPLMPYKSKFEGLLTFMANPYSP